MARKYRKLARTDIRTLEPGKTLHEHGIIAERLPGGDIRWSVNIMADGERVHRIIGLDRDGVRRGTCERFIEDARTKAREERLSLPKRRKTHLTFKIAAKDYLKRLEEGDGKNLTAKKRHVHQRLVPFFGDQRLNAISTFTIDRYKKRRQGEGAENGTINRELATLSHLFNMAVEWKWLTARPCKVRPLPESVGRIIALTDEQTDTLLAAAIEDADTYCWLFVAFGLNTAMRHSEILRTRFEHVDFENLRLHVPKAKAGMREQPITKELADILRKEREMADDPKGWIFPSPRPGSSLTGHRHRMDKPFRRAVIAAGLDPKTVTPHVMRHTAITNLVQAGVDLPTIQRISGHKTLTMVMRYTHVHGSHIDEAIRAIGRGLPEPQVNKTGDSITPKLHTVPKRTA